MDNNRDLSIQKAIRMYLESVHLTRSKNTGDTYEYALKLFSEYLIRAKLDVEKFRIQDLSEDVLLGFATKLKDYSPATERLYLIAVAGFYEFISAELLAQPNLPRVRLIIKQRARRPGQRLPQFPREAIDAVIEYAAKLVSAPAEDDADRLRNLRDRAFLLTLSDTGLRVHEACGLRRGDIDWNEGRAIIVGKGNQQAVVRFSQRSLAAIKDYLAARAVLDGGAGRSLTSLPLFARHDPGAGKKIKTMTTTTGRNIVAERVKEALGAEAVGTITPHSFRHYFVTTVLRASGNLKMAQELARHKNIAVTQRYAHLSNDELDKGYWDIFENKPKEDK